jgi:hypothetical protein
MTCEYVKDNAVLLVYGELADDARFEMERHVERCAACAAEVGAIRHFQETMSTAPMPEPSPSLLAASRMRLQEELEHVEHRRGWQRFFLFDLAGWMYQARMAPAMVAVLLIVGFAGGALTTWRMKPSTGGSAKIFSPASTPAEANISGIRSINPDPADQNKVQINYDTVTRQQVEGSLTDPKIQQLLLYAAHSNVNPGVRNDAADLLTRQSGDQQVREALIYGLRYDNNTGVRLKAIEALKPYVKQDVHVRDAVVEAVLNDASPGVRTEAILALDAVKADSSVRRVLMDLAERDHNQYIRRKAQDMLNQLPQIE